MKKFVHIHRFLYLYNKKTGEIMLGKLPKINQRDMFRTMLKDLIAPRHELALLADKIDWQYFHRRGRL
jgi:IS5 family transposase